MIEIYINKSFLSINDEINKKQPTFQNLYYLTIIENHENVLDFARNSPENHENVLDFARNSPEFKSDKEKWKAQKEDKREESKPVQWGR